MNIGEVGVVDAVGKIHDDNHCLCIDPCLHTPSVCHALPACVV